MMQTHDPISDSFATLPAFWEKISTWLANAPEHLLSEAAAWQAGAILVAGLLGFLASRIPVAKLRAAAKARLELKPGGDMLGRLYHSLARILWPAITVALLWVATIAFGAVGDLENEALRVVASLLNAWIVVRLITANMQDSFWSRAIALIAWTVAALYILRLIEPVSRSLDATAIEVGDFRLSVLKLFTSVFVASLALWAGRIAGDAAQTQLSGAKSLTPSMAGLLGQVAKVGLMIIAVVFALSSVGIDLTALAVFSGALGVGIGFGLQAIFSNFISGVIILLEKSVRVGDFIELQSGITGQVREINIRSTLVTTNDNVDILVPNEEFIKAQVINWTLREALRRIRVKFGVAYGSDKEIVKKAGLEAAANVTWTFSQDKARAPQVWLVNFGDSSLDFELVVWLTEDAVARPAKVMADYNWEIHTALQKYEIEIPFPQRDLNLRPPAKLQVELIGGGEA